MSSVLPELSTERMISIAFQFKFLSLVSGPSRTPSKIALQTELRKARWKLLLKYSGPLLFKSSLGPLKAQSYEAMKHQLLAAIAQAFQRLPSLLYSARSSRGRDHGPPRQLRVRVMGLPGSVGRFEEGTVYVPDLVEWTPVVAQGAKRKLGVQRAPKKEPWADSLGAIVARQVD